MTEDFIGVLDALALVGFRRSLGSDVGSKLANLLLVDAVDDDLVGSRNLNGDAVDLFHVHKVRETKVHNELVAFLGSSVADAVDLELLLEALGHADDHVIHQRAGQTVQALVELVFGQPYKGKGIKYTTEVIRHKEGKAGGKK